ncbi:CRM-domain containing factor CFM3B, chloroplastic-like [Amaranthus tricolor]|uniref:CRM-domain containing factor CFM3B, chloroplastic-like n=1 Tax=Amaranthus tricolor TaxID=29722 RepID=UPI00258E1895|nr:CRM-domain containing factor CFM3B, chloroplastic-like [Amaranthus tricolor]
MKERLKVGSTGVTQSLVDATHEKWKIDEVVKLKFESQSRFNMKRIHDVLETIAMIPVDLQSVVQFGSTKDEITKQLVL